jgi:hypothetical protein
MKLYDGGKILAGLLIFLGLLSIPLWYQFGKSPAAPPLSLDTPQIRSLAQKECIEPADYMRAHHMDLIDLWRKTVVREGFRVYLSSSGREISMSLSQTCLGCHSNKEKFCDACHNFSGVKPNCWNCHVVPKETI